MNYILYVAGKDVCITYYILYYFAGKDEEVSLKMVIPEKLRSEVLDLCHRHMGR